MRMGRDGTATTPFSIPSASINYGHSLREVSFPATWKVSINIPVGLAGVKTRWIYVGVFSLHTNVKDVPLHCVLEDLGQIVLADYRLNLPSNKGQCCFLHLIDNIVPLLDSLRGTLHQSLTILACSPIMEILPLKRLAMRNG